MTSQPRAPQSRDRTYFLVALVSLVAVLAVASLAGYFASAPPPRTTPTGPSRFSADHLDYDFGIVPQATVSHSFEFRNLGTGDLRVWGLTSSCDCTSGHVVISGVPGPHLGMHTDSPWVGVVAPGASATLVAIYDATQMPDRYVGSRQLYLSTNDPAQSIVTFTIWVHEGP